MVLLLFLPDTLLQSGEYNYIVVKKERPRLESFGLGIHDDLLVVFAVLQNLVLRESYGEVVLVLLALKGECQVLDVLDLDRRLRDD